MPSTSTTREQIESLALQHSFIAASFSFIAALIYTINATTIPVFGIVSIAGSLLGICAVIPLVLFPIAYIRGIKIHHPITTIRWKQRFHSFILSIAYTIFYVGIAALLIAFLDNAFKGLYLDSITAALISAAAAAITAYSVTQFAANIDSMAIIHTLIVFLLAGVCASMVFNNNPLWWQYNLSYLGGFDSNTWWLFNFTLILSGLLMLALTDYLFRDLKSAIHGHIGLVNNSSILRLFFVIIAICLTLVGLFPYIGDNIVSSIHNIAASTLVGAFIIVIGGIRLLLPGFSNTFYITSYAFGATLIGLYMVLFQYYRYLSLTAFELLAFFICFIWLYLLLKTIAARKLDEQEQ